MTGPERRSHLTVARVVDIAQRAGRRLTELEVALSRIEAARALHAPCHGEDAPDLHDCRCPIPVSEVVPCCVRDGETWPCSDERALTGRPFLT